MTPWIQVLLLTTLAGAAMPVGGALAWFENILPDWLDQELRHTVMAMSGGVLLAAVALVLLPEGLARLRLGGAVAAITAGALVFCWLDIALARRKTPASQLMAMLLDFLPEALALGAAFATAGSVGLLLALFIALQNLPEGFNAYRELLRGRRHSRVRILGLFMAMVPLGPLAGLAGLYWLSAFPSAVGFIMLFASGGILYLLFQDIAPQARLARHWSPPLGAVVGFVIGVVGHALIAG